MKVLFAILIFIIIYFQYRIWIGEGSFAQVHALQKQISKQQAENERLRERNRILAAEVEALKSGTGVEGVARSELGLIKKDETFYKVIDDKK